MLDALTPERRDELIDFVATKITKYGMTTPAIFFFETARPLSFIGSQLTWFASPILGIFVNETNVEEIALMLEDRSNVERLLQRLEAIEFEIQAKEKAAKEAAKEAKKLAAGGEKKKKWGIF